MYLVQSRNPPRCRCTEIQAVWRKRPSPWNHLRQRMRRWLIFPLPILTSRDIARQQIWPLPASLRFQLQCNSWRVLPTSAVSTLAEVQLAYLFVDGSVASVCTLYETLWQLLVHAWYDVSAIGFAWSCWWFHCGRDGTIRTITRYHAYMLLR